jgi:uncharacterized membrane protein
MSSRTWSHRRQLLGLSCLLVGASCSVPAPPDAGPACDAIAPDFCDKPTLRFVDVQPLFEIYCVTCHYGQAGGPWPLKSHMDIADWTDVVRDDLVDCSMPPADAGTSMTREERALILDWLRCGAPE